ncbi:MAG: type II toxin-antitoxin system VapC family toxin [Armatimonadetes bacterium]|nr:type II toxin-antitoxin system VapC family toxin [Armatimonadota bacterium]
MKVTYDANIFIGRKVEVFPRGFFLSTVVLAELQAGAQDRSDMKRFEVLRRTVESFDQLLVPSAEDWWETGKALQRLSQGSKLENFGSTPRISPEERHRLFNDVLLAVSCRRAGITLITDNLKDFERIANVCRIKFSSGDEFFTPPDVSV